MVGNTQEGCMGLDLCCDNEAWMLRAELYSDTLSFRQVRVLGKINCC